MLDLKAVAADFDSFERRLARRGEKAAAALAPVKPLALRRRASSGRTGARAWAAFSPRRASRRSKVSKSAATALRSSMG